MQGKGLRGERSRPLGRALGGAMVLTLGLALSACQHTIDDLGYVPDPDNVVRIKPGLQGRDEVREILGSPSSTSTFTDDRWYYISKKTETVAFFQPTTLDQNVLEIDFDKDGIVSEVRRYTLKDGEQVEPVARVTPSPGQKLTFIQQLLGNLGRFNANNQRDQPGADGGP